MVERLAPGEGKEVTKEEKYRLDVVTQADEKEQPKDEEKQGIQPFSPLDISEDMKKEIAKLVMKEVRADNPERKAFIKHCRKMRQRYLMEDLNQSAWPGASRRRTAGTTIHVNRLMPRIHNAVWDNGLVIRATPTLIESEDFTPLRQEQLGDIAKKHERFQDFEFRERMDLDQGDLSDNLEYDSTMLNHGILKNSFVFDEERKEEIITYETANEVILKWGEDVLFRYPKLIEDLSGIPIADAIEITAAGQKLPELPEGDRKSIRILETYWDVKVGQRGENIHPGDMVWARGTKNWKKTPLAAHRLRMRKDEILRKIRDGFFEDIPEDELFKGDKDKKNVDISKEYDIWEVYLLYDYDEDDLEEKVLCWIFAGDDGSGQKYLRGIRYPYTHGEPHTILFGIQHRRYGLYTMGLGAMLEGMSSSEDMMTNAITNAWQQAVVKAWKVVVDGSSPFRPRIHRFFPGAIMPVKDPNEITELAQSDIPSSSITLREDNRMEGEMLVGAPRGSFSGQVNQQDPRGPARKTEVLLDQAQINVADYVKHYTVALRDLAYQTQSNYYQFMDDTDKINFRDDTGLSTLSKMELRTKMRYTLDHAIKAVNAKDLAQSMVAFEAALVDNPMYVGNTSARAFVYETFVENFDPIFARNMDRMVPEGTEERIEQERQANEAAQAEAQEIEQATEAIQFERGLSKQDAEREAVAVVRGEAAVA